MRDNSYSWKYVSQKEQSIGNINNKLEPVSHCQFWRKKIEISFPSSRWGIQEIAYNGMIMNSYDIIHYMIGRPPKVYEKLTRGFCQAESLLLLHTPCLDLTLAIALSIYDSSDSLIIIIDFSDSDIA